MHFCGELLANNVDYTVRNIYDIIDLLKVKYSVCELVAQHQQRSYHYIIIMSEL